MMRPLIRLLICVSALTATAAQAEWPTRPIKVIVGFAPGGTSDVTARVVGEAAGRALGQVVTVENRPGADGTIAADLVANADPDGYTLLVAPDASLFQPLVRASLRYSFDKSFAPVALLTSQPIVVLANPALGVKTLQQMVAVAKAAPNPMPYATASANGSQRVIAETFFSQAGIRLDNIPYKGGGQAVIDLLSGQVNVGMLGTPPVMPHIESGRLVALAVTTRERSSTLPNVPTVAESGYPGFDMPQWFCIVAPKGTPPAVLSRLTKAFVGALEDPEVKSRLKLAGLEAVGDGPDKLSQRVKAESVLWRDAVTAHGLQVK